MMKPTLTELDEMTLEELVNYTSGLLVISIGQGKFRFMVSVVIQTMLQIGFDRGVRSVKKDD
jgi:hypothetical protein